MLAICVYASFVYFGHLPWLFTPTLTTTHLPPQSTTQKANSPDATFARCSLYARARIEKIG